MSERTPERNSERSGQQRIERLIFWISLVIVLGVVGALIKLDSTPGPAGPAIAGRVLDTRQVGESQQVRYEIRNRGNRSVADVTLVITLGDQEVSQTMSHLPQGLTREGVALFDKASPGSEASVKVEGYLEP